MSELRLVVPAIPPSGNNYTRARIVVPRSGKPFISWYHTAEAEAWWATVAAYNRGQQIRGGALELQYIVYTVNKRGRADWDNYGKTIGDALTKCGAIEDDRFILDGHGHLRIDPLNPRTVILVKCGQEALAL